MSNPIVLSAPAPPPQIHSASGPLDTPTTALLLTALAQFIALPSGVSIAQLKTARFTANADGSSQVSAQYSVASSAAVAAAQAALIAAQAAVTAAQS